MTSRLQIAVMAQEALVRFETDEDGEEYVNVPDICGRAWWGFIHRWAETIRDDGCSTCGEHAVQFVSALHDLVNIKLMGDGDKTKVVHDPENFTRVARHYHQAVHTAGLECPVCDPVMILAPTAQELPHAHMAQDPTQRSLFDVPAIEPAPEAPEVLEGLTPFRFDTKLVRTQGGIEGPQVDSPRAVNELVKDIVASDRERLVILYVDTKNRLIGAQEATVGTKNASLLPNDVVARTAILANASGIFVVHNHPSGDPTPSPEDVRATSQLGKALNLFDIEVIDHIVIGEGRFVSLREKGLLGTAAAAQDAEFMYPDRIQTTPDLVRDVATMAQDQKIRISGTCEHDGPCRIKVRAVDEAVESVNSADQVANAVDEAHRQLLARRAGNVTDRTFAIGANSVTRYQFQFRVVDASELIVSNDPFNFEPNPEFPEELQPRDRARTADRLQVEKLAANISPDALLEDFRVLDRGTPIVGPDLVVEGGNGRAMALIRAASDFQEQYRSYRGRLVERIREFGLEPSDIDGVKTPVLVRVRLTEVDRAQFAAETNTPPGISTSAIESANADANNITVDMLRQLEVLDDETLADALRATRNSQFVRTFLESLPGTEQAELVDSAGVINQDGIRRMVLAVFISAFPGDDGIRLAELGFESIDLQIRNVVNALSRALGLLATAEALTQSGERQQDLAIADDLAAAAIILARIKSTPGLVVEMFLNQSQLFERELTPFQEEVLQFLDLRSRSARRMSEAIINYANLVIDSPPPSQGTLIPGAELTKEGLWRSAVSESETGTAAQDPRDAVQWCNLEQSDIDRVWSWRPLRDLLVTGIASGAIVEVCEVGFAGDQVQVTIDTKPVLAGNERPTEILRAAERLGGAAERVLIQEPGVWLWLVTQAADSSDLVLLPQVPEPVKRRSEPGDQATLFSAPMGQDSVLSRFGAGAAMGTGFNLGSLIVNAAVSRLTKATNGHSLPACGELTPQALKLDISGSGDFVRERIENPELFHPESFRTVVQDEHRLIVACRAPKFEADQPKDRHCVDGLELQSVLHPRRCVAGLVASAEELGIPIVDDGIADEIEEALAAAGMPNNWREKESVVAKQSQQIAVTK